ncbi:MULTISPECIES: FMN-binding glutamate synthase family protein [unclassified Microbulbifer]|uniref:FMN-binding glutamate synthase family protein n=1 Tax=unclassified Microbulbifer TaxID=2619833 RepID=UPI0027E48DDD|nr:MULTISPECIES: FMN-binding glutamate synthase family protein [unclassified Microbulbifer]
MVRTVFYYLAVLTPLLVAAGGWFWPPAWWLLGVVLPLIAIGIYDVFSRHNVLNNYPVIGHLRYLLEFLRPELRQYFFESETSGRPFNREQRNTVNARADGKPDISAFGTIQDVENAGFDFARHSLVVRELDESAGRIVFGGPQCDRPYHGSRLNISAMSFGSLSANAIRAMNRGAALGGFAHNTGEGGLSPYHLEYGADVIWELGSAYFGCRTKTGRFDAQEFAEKAANEHVKMIEIKLSQGAKPSYGGLLPAVKITEEIARTRGIEMGRDCLSPPSHPEFDTPTGLLEFIAGVRELAGGKPVGFKLCLGWRSEFMGICKAMRETGILPDFITVDGAEGGTGAAPTEFTDRLGSYINDALPFVHNALVGTGLRDDIRIIASGKVAMGFDMVVKHALGANACNAARPFMFAVGCIQARRCHTNKCPTGVTTQDPRRVRAVDVHSKGVRVRNFHRGTIDAFLKLTAALGCAHPDELSPDLIFHRPEYGPAQPYADLYPQLRPGQLLENDLPPEYARDWRAASADRF